MSFTFISVSYYQTNNKDHIISWWGRHSSWRKNDCCEDLSFATDASRTARRCPRIRHFAQSIFRLEPIGVLHHRCSLWNFAVATVSIHFLPSPPLTACVCSIHVSNLKVFDPWFLSPLISTYLWSLYFLSTAMKGSIYFWIYFASTFNPQGSLSSTHTSYLHI